ncbi:MAG: hypothetical protein Q8O28_04365 [Smithellaceae bacterium]|nr:hypothetical protein [Smithellaceae bacterium]
MKKTMKTKLAIGTFAVALGVAFLLPQPSHATDADVQDYLWGAAEKVEKLANGSEIRYYKSNAESVEMYRVVEVQKDGAVIFKKVILKAETY